MTPSAASKLAKITAQRVRLAEAGCYLERAQAAHESGDLSAAAELVAQARRILHRFAHVHHTTGG